MDNWISNIPYTFQSVIWKLYKFCLQGEYIQYRLLGSDILNIKSYYVNNFKEDDEKLCTEYLAFTKEIENIWFIIVKIINDETNKLVPINKSYSIYPEEFTASETHNIDGSEKANIEILKITDNDFISVSENGNIVFIDDNSLKQEDYNKINENHKNHLLMVLAAEKDIITNAQPIINEFIQDKLANYKQLANSLFENNKNSDDSIFEQNIFCDYYTPPILDIINIASGSLTDYIYTFDNIEISENINKCLDIINYTPEFFGEEFINKLNSLVKILNNPTNQDIDDIYNYYNKVHDFQLVFHSLYVPGFRLFPSLNTILGVSTFIPEDNYFVNRKINYIYKNQINLNVSVVFPLYKNAAFTSNKTGYKIADKYVLFENTEEIDYYKWLTIIKKINTIIVDTESFDVFKGLYEKRVNENNYNILTNTIKLGLKPVKEIEYINSHWEIEL
jgi:hypothetical protein